MLSFQESILSWYDENKRDLPWRKTNSAYFIWISEVILQQTRVEQGLPFYRRFVERFPDVNSLAAAEENQVLAVWKGLGYYSRARKLHHAAKLIVEQGQGFPNSFNSLINFPGIGPYTAGAIASIAYNEPVPALDGNAFRIMSRVFNVSNPISSSKAQKLIQSLAKEWISKSRPGDFNQALMDLGSSVCTPRQPNCPFCPLNAGCDAFTLGNFHERPVKAPKKPHKHRFLIFNLHFSDQKIGFDKVTKGNVWKNLYLFPFKEFANEEDWLYEVQLLKLQEGDFLPRGLHLLSHQKIHFFTQVSTGLSADPSRMKWISEEELQHMATPAIVAKILNQYKIKSSPVD
jgi:A/G-specific adenine glycosylase